MSGTGAQARICCYTSFTYSYLPRARILVETLRRAHPDWELWALVVDEPPAGLDEVSALREFDHVVRAKELGFPRFLAWMFKHDLVEACTAVKGQMMVHLLDQGADKIVYFDPDIAVFNPVTEVIDSLDTASVVLTPHQVQANVSEMAVQDNEITSLLYGVFNLGFIAIANNSNGRAFAEWWAKQLHRACYDDVPHGIFTDQKYCDLIPALFDGVQVNRDPGCNVASWNLSRRTLRLDRDGLSVNGSPLKFYHFTKIGGAGDDMTERYGGANLEVFEIWNWYKRQVQAKQVVGIPCRYWHYGNFADGAPIPKSVRMLFRSRQDLMDFFDDPFDIVGNSFYEWLRREEPTLLGDAPSEGRAPAVAA